MTPLEGSILKWEKICKDRRSVDNSEINCLLCKAHKSCKGCPVSKRTAITGCVGTPYQRWVDHQIDVHDSSQPFRRQKGCKICDELAQKELDFLRSLKN
ncbi:hypothetical protein KAR91_33170 [Candidatus Pacearchaeota archaeon]|nr:hypothetical protein [Candidatus Pacearchaeota archaeon]